MYNIGNNNNSNNNNNNNNNNKISEEAPWEFVENSDIKL